MTALKYSRYSRFWRIKSLARFRSSSVAECWNARCQKYTPCERVKIAGVSSGLTRLRDSPSLA